MIRMPDFRSDPIGCLTQLPKREMIIRAVVVVSSRKCKSGGRTTQVNVNEGGEPWMTREMKWALGDLAMFCAEETTTPGMPFGECYTFEKEVEDNTLLLTATKVTNWVWMLDVLWDTVEPPRPDDPVVRTTTAAPEETTDDPA